MCANPIHVYLSHVLCIHPPHKYDIYMDTILLSKCALAGQEALKGFAQVMNGKPVSKLSEELVNVASQSVTPPPFHRFLFCVRKAATPHCET